MSSFNKRAVNLIGLGRKLPIPDRQVLVILNYLGETDLKVVNPRDTLLDLKRVIDDDEHTPSVDECMYAGFCLGYAMSQTHVQLDLEEAMKSANQSGNP